MRKYVLALVPACLLLFGTAAVAANAVSDAIDGTAEATGDLFQKAADAITGRPAPAQTAPGPDTRESLARQAADAADKAADYIDDATITGLAKAKLLRHKGLEGSEISVTTDKGLVTLAGTVRNETQIYLAETIIDEIHGVTGVASTLTVAGEEKSRGVAGYLDDAGTTAAVKSRLIGQRGIDSLDISVSTDNGVTTLEGKVDNPAQVVLAEKVAWEVEGVKSVHNKLTVDADKYAAATARMQNASTGTVATGQTAAKADSGRSVGEYLDDAGITAAVKGRLLAQKGIDSLDISVATTDRVVTLSGQVDNATQIVLAEKVAWAVGDVRSVRNTMTIKDPK